MVVHFGYEGPVSQAMPSCHVLFRPAVGRFSAISVSRPHRLFIVSGCPYGPAGLLIYVLPLRRLSGCYECQRNLFGLLRVCCSGRLLLGARFCVRVAAALDHA